MEKIYILKLKYGFDGTSAKSYNQKWSGDMGNDTHIFCSSVVPLELSRADTKEIIWTNPRPSSVRLCRPIRIQFIKETSEISKNEEEDLKNQIDKLRPYTAKGCTTFYELQLTMIDGKVTLSKLY